MAYRRKMSMLCVLVLALAVRWSDSAPAAAPARAGVTVTEAAPERAPAQAPVTVSVSSSGSCTALPNGGSNNVTSDGTLIVRNVTSNGGNRTFVVDPWIQPPCSNSSGTVKCNCNNTVTGAQNGNFLKYPVINATCADRINFTVRAIQSGLRVHGVYLLHYSFVDPKSPRGYWCPSPLTDVEVRNHNTTVSAGRCRGYNIEGFTLANGSFFPVDSDVECSGYYTLDNGYLQVLSYGDENGNCSTSTIKVFNDQCLSAVNVPVNIGDIADALGFRGNKTRLVFSCPNIAGNQPGNATAGSHCDDGMVLVVNVDCTPPGRASPPASGDGPRLLPRRGAPAPAPAPLGGQSGVRLAGGSGLAPSGSGTGLGTGPNGQGGEGETGGGLGNNGRQPTATPGGTGGTAGAGGAGGSGGAGGTGSAGGTGGAGGAGGNGGTGPSGNSG